MAKFIKLADAQRNFKTILTNTVRHMEFKNILPTTTNDRYLLD